MKTIPRAQREGLLLMLVCLAAAGSALPAASQAPAPGGSAAGGRPLP